VVLWSKLGMERIKIQDLSNNTEIRGGCMNDITGGYRTYCKAALQVTFMGNRAQRIHSMARAQRRMLSFVLANVRADISNGKLPM
jgi:hypothetical protein